MGKAARIATPPRKTTIAQGIPIYWDPVTNQSTVTLCGSPEAINQAMRMFHSNMAGNMATPTPLPLQMPKRTTSSATRHKLKLAAEKRWAEKRALAGKMKPKAAGAAG